MKIELYNDVEKTTKILLVNERDYKVLERLQYAGGFYRFGLSIYDDTKGREKDKILSFLQGIFKNSEMVSDLFKNTY